MNNLLKKFGKNLSVFGNRAMLKVQKNSPEILMACGILGIGGTIILACRATMKSEQVIDRHNYLMQDASMEADIEEKTKKEIQKEKIAVYAQTSLDMVKLYAPAVTLGTVSISMILASSNILKKRYLGAVAAYNAVSSTFDIYRNRVREELGEEMDRHFRYGTRKETRDIVEVDEKGKEKVVGKEEVEIMEDPIFPSEYAKYFDESNPNWDPNPMFNLTFLRAQQSMATDILNSRGHIFLNEVYDMLGLPHTQIGAVTGWVLGEGDDYVDFGLYEKDNRRFINGNENVILLDFNVSGVIWDKI